MNVLARVSKLEQRTQSDTEGKLNVWIQCQAGVDMFESNGVFKRRAEIADGTNDMNFVFVFRKD